MKLKNTIILALLVVSQTVLSQITHEKKTIIKVLSFNILHGATTKRDFDLELLAKVINDANPDFVAMQEVDFKTKRARNYDLVTELGLRTKMAGVFGKAMDFDGGEYGEGVLSKYTFLKVRNVALPFSEGNEPRTAIEITSVISSGDTISFIGTHLDHLNNEKDRVAQAKKINEVFSFNEYPTILAGDLNATPNSTPINILEELWKSSYNRKEPKLTYPSNNPSKKIDYVMFYPKNRWKILKTEIIQNTIASDHCAYLVTVELLKE